MGCYIWYSEETGRGLSPPRPLLTVPNVAAHPLTTSVRTSYYLMWHYNCLWTLKGLGKQQIQLCSGIRKESKVHTLYWTKVASSTAICATRQRFLCAIISLVLYPPRIPTPSARICSSSGVAPPVINVRISVSALSLKYVYAWRQQERSQKFVTNYDNSDNSTLSLKKFTFLLFAITKSDVDRFQ